MMLAVTDLLGIAGLPATLVGIRKWLHRCHVPMHKNGKRLEFSLSDLPEPERLAFLARRAETTGLPMGNHDDEAHLDLAAKPIGVQNTAYARAETMMFIAKHEAVGLKWGQIAGLLREEAAKDGSAVLAPSHMTVTRWAKMIAGVDAVNWAPVLAPKYQGRTVTAEISPEAWARFEDLIGMSGKNGTKWPLKSAHEKVEKEAMNAGWAWPCYRTVMRHWERLDEVRKRVLRDGPEEAAKSLTQYQPRSVEGLFAMQQVELDGREFKVLVRFRDGRIGCPWVIIFVDRASNRIVGYEVSESENEEAAARVTIRMAETYGIPCLVVTDNGAAFNGKRMAGGLNPIVKRKKMRSPDWEVPGVFKLLGIELHNTRPNHGQSKVPESVFSIMRRFDNDPIFHRAQRAGPNDTSNPNPVPVDIELFEKALELYVDEFNARRGSRAQGLLPGESRNDAFARLSAGRIARTVTPLQARSVRMKWLPKTVMRDGRIKFDGGLFGDATTQAKMLKHVGKKVLIGINPNDYHSPAMVRGWEDERLRGCVLVASLPLYEATRHGDEAGRRRAVAENRRVKNLVEKHKTIDIERKVAALRESIMVTDTSAPPPAKPKVVTLNTDMPFSDRPVEEPQDLTPLQAKLQENMKRKLAAQKAAG